MSVNLQKGQKISLTKGDGRPEKDHGRPGMG